MLPPGATPECHASADGQAPWSLTTSSTLGSAYSGLYPFTGIYVRTGKIVRGIPIVTSTLRPLAEVSSSSSSVASPDPDSSYDYPEIGISACGDSAGEGRLIFMVALNGDPLHNTSSRYPTIGTLEASDARTSNDGIIQNLNLDFNAIRLQTIMESIQQMAPEGSSLVALAQQGAEVANVIMAQRLAGNPRGEPSVDNDVRWRITQNRYPRECGRDREDLSNIIDDQRHHRAWTLTPPRCSPVRDITPSGRGGFCALSPSLRQVV
jgi:hypothetical protein